MSSYTTTTNKLKITELDFNAIKQALKTYLQGQDVFKDYNFDGSAMSILLDILAYNTHYNGFYANMLASEMFMDSAALRSSVVSLAKHLGYTPASKKGATVRVDITFSGIAGLTNILIPKNSKILTKLGESTYTFLTTQAHAAKLTESGSYQALNVEIKEGVSYAVAYSASGANNEIFAIPNEDVDISTLEVALGGEIFQKAEDYTEINSSSKVYFVQEGRDEKYEIYFGDGIIGQKADTADIVEIGYNASVLGSGGNGLRKFAFGEPLENITTGIIAVSLSEGQTRAAGGAEREATSTIRIQAPRQYALQKRVVTAQDYKARLINDYNLVDSVRVWGGEENTPKQYGKVFISVKPKTGFTLSRSEKQNIADNILKRRGVVGVRPVFVDPDYLFVVPDITFAYDPRKTTREADELISMVKLSILSYAESGLGKFDEYFRHSVMSRAIDDTEISILNNVSDITVKKRIKPILGVGGNFRLLYDNPLHRPHVGHRNILTSSLFGYNGYERCSLVDKDGIIKIVQADLKSLQISNRYGDRRRVKTAGNLIINVKDQFTLERTLEEDNYGQTPNSDLGKEIVGDIGKIDYDTGEIFLENFTPTSILNKTDYIYLSVVPRIEDIMPQGNTIVTIESEDINVTAVDDTDRLEQLKTQSY